MTEFLPAATVGHNLGPVTAPTDLAMRADLETRYPEVKTELDEMEKALKSFPEKIETEEDAKSLTDNLGKISKLRKSWKAFRADEKKPWNGIIGIIQNYFASGEEKLEALDDEWRPRLKVYQDKKDADAAAARQREIDRQHEENERLTRERAELEMDAVYLDALKELAEFDERKLRERLDREAAERAEAERIAGEKAAQEKLEADAKRARDREEKERNDKGICEAKALLKMADQRNDLAEADEGTAEDAQMLEQMIKAGGQISTIMGPIASSVLLTTDQADDVQTIKTRLTELRESLDERSNKRARARRAAAQAAEEAAERDRAETRMRDEADEELRLFDLRKEREAAEARAAAAKSAEQLTRGDIRETREAGRDAATGLKEAGRAVKNTAREEERGQNRADRMQRRHEDTTDGGRVRGEYSATSSKTGRWTHNVMDEPALRAVCGPLGEHFTLDALSSAAFQWMAAHREGFVGERFADPALPGVVFIWEEGLAIRA